MSLSNLPTIINALKPGQRYKTPRPAGSGDAWYLAQLSRALKKEKIIVLCADPLDASRLAEEINLFDTSLKVCQFPDWETLPYDHFSPHQDLISERLKTLHALMQKNVDILTVPVTTALYHIAPPSFLAAYSFAFEKGQRINESALRDQLILANYEHVSQVTAPGEFSIRGSIIDLFPMGSALPYRIDLFDDEVDSIRSFDIDTQRSLYPVNQIALLPGREFPLDENSRTAFRARFREVFEGDPSKALPYKDIGNGIAFAGIESYLPLFFEEKTTLFDYLPDNNVIVTLGDSENSIAQFLEDTQNRYRFLKSDNERPVLSPEQLFLDKEQFFALLQNFARLHFDSSSLHPEIIKAPDVAVSRRSEDPLEKLKEICYTPNLKVILCADSGGRRETLNQMLKEMGLAPSTLNDSLSDVLKSSASFELVIAPLNMGFYIPEQQLLFLTENDLYPATTGTSGRRKRREQHSDIEAMVRDLAELREGDPVVHMQYGIGRYRGLITMDLGEGDIELLHLEYAKDATLYVPVSQLHVIARYSGADPEHAPLHLLGSGQWDKARKKAEKQVRDTAAELLALYAARASREGYQFNLPLSDYQLFKEGFGFEETPDQYEAIEAVLRDMTSGKPMDRLVCGDVGFGKTEVALRAAFLAVANSKQVAMLCPTTLLAEQHAHTFADRFADWPIKIAELSRFKTGKEVTAALEGLEKGSVDIVIGTHKLLAKTVKFKQLGLVIIDEEHRFGVRQKEALKALRAEVDILTLTATPIPRTLGMSLEGIRDFSVIATAPQKRLAIKTFVRNEDGSTIREAILRELKRGGQVYFLHNEVDTIHNRKARLEELVPEARIEIAHGQMPERELERVMKDFYHQRFNVLLCTTIIETGIDNPSANTIVIHRADKLGLAQLHQLRGRVGRSHHQAYAYLLTPGEDATTANAKKRLEAIQSMEELGSGFFLAMHDLEIRGTGEVLGESQSGNIHEIGFSMYSDMLNAAVKSLKAGEEPDFEATLNSGCEIKLHISALLPSDYCPDVHIRLSIYKKLSHAKSEDDLIRIQEELIDRFGKLPDAAKMLMHTHRLRILAEPIGIQKIDLSAGQAVLHFNDKSSVDPFVLITLVQQSKTIRFSGPEKLKMDLSQYKDQSQRLDALRDLLKSLSKKPT